MKRFNALAAAWLLMTAVCNRVASGTAQGRTLFFADFFHEAAKAGSK